MKFNNRLLQAVLRNSFSCFTEKSFATVSPGSAYLHNWHLDIINYKLAQVQAGEVKRLIINIPPRYLKSITISVAWTAWLLGHDPSLRIMTASYSQALSNKHSQDCRLLLNSKWYQDLFPWTRITKGESQKSKFVTTKRGFRFSTSTGGTATGEGGDILIVDDPQNPNKINSRKYRKNTIEWFEQTFVSRLNNKKNGAIILIMQRLHENDLCGYLLKNKSQHWDHLKIPAIYEEETIFTKPYKLIIDPGAVLHEEREDINALNKLKSELGQYNFAAQYNQDPIPSAGSMIQKSWIKYYKNNDKILFTQIIQSWDTAIKAKDDHDYTVGITMGVNKDGYYLLDVCRVKVEFPQLVELLKNKCYKWLPQVVLIEDKGSGQSLIQILSREIKAPIIGIKPKFDKVTRFAIHSTKFETGQIFINSEASWRVAFEHELLAFPKASHDDQVDALSQALSYLQRRKIAQVREL